MSKSKEQEHKQAKREEEYPTISVTSGSFPLHLFIEWDEDCKKNFGNRRWMKMWHDHVFTQKFDMFLKLFDEIQMLKNEITKLKAKPKENVPQTLSGEKVE